MHQSGSSNSSTNGSSRGHRKTQRVNIGSEVLGLTVGKLSLRGTIPTRFAQLILSGHACFFRPELKPTEHFTHACQAFLTLTQIAIIAALYFTNAEDTCEESNTDLCKILSISDLFYTGILLINWAHAEAYRDFNETTQQSTIVTGLSNGSPRERQDTPPETVLELPAQRV